jgi:subtilisin family serine protease
LIVEFVDDPANARSANQATTRERRALLKRGLGLRLGRDAEVLMDYDALPMSFNRVRGSRALAALLSDPRVKAVYPNVAHTRMDVQSLPLINQPLAAGAGFTGRGTSVAVLDTGLDFTRPAFGNCMMPGWPASCRVVASVDIAFPDFVRDDKVLHGTNVAGIIAAVAPETKLIGVDVFTGPFALTFNLINGVNWVIKNQARYNIVAMNLSLGDRSRSNGDCPSSWATTPFANARAAGVIPVVASGNNAFSDGISSPACAPGAVSVGAVYDSNVGPLNSSVCNDESTAADQVTCFSSSSPRLNMLAPGAFITAAGVTMAGTSQAAPHVAGAIAVMRGVNAAPHDTLDQTMSRLTTTGVPLIDPRNGLVRPRLDLWRATQTIGQPAP